MVKLRLLEVVSGFGLGGAERALLTRMKYIPSTFEQQVLNIRPEIDVLELDQEILEHKFAKRGFFRLIAINRFLRRNEFDFMIVRTPLDAIRFGFLQKLNRKRSGKLVFEAHSNFVSKKIVLNYLMQVLLRAVSSKFDLSIAVSQNVFNGPLCRGHKNAKVVYLGAELTDSLQLETTPNTSRLVFVGRLVDLKRPIWLLERLVAIRSQQLLPENALTIVGSGPLEKRVKDFIATERLEGVVNFVGEQFNVAPFLLSSTHLVSPSTNEGLPLTFFEAKLAGLLILATPSGGGSEIFDTQDQKLKTFDELEFENALVRIFDSPPPSLAERKRIQRDSSWMNADQCAKNYYDLLTRLMSE